MCSAAQVGQGQACVAVIFIRGGRVLGAAPVSEDNGGDESEEVVAAFLTQYYA